MQDLPDDPEAFRQALAAAAPGFDDLVVRADPRGVILYVSESCRRFGYEPEELVGRSSYDFVHPADLARFTANSARLFDRDLAEQNLKREFRYRRADGSWAWLEGHPTILPARDGRLGDILNVFRDVTERRTLAEALRLKAGKAPD